MSQTLRSSLPGIWTALTGLVQAAAAAQSPPIPVFLFELGEYEPGRYITVHKINGPKYTWENIGTFTQREVYSIEGTVTTFSGASQIDDPNVAGESLDDTFDLYYQCVAEPIMSNRTMPLLGTTGPSPNLMLPDKFEVDPGPGRDDAGDPWGWQTVLIWSFAFTALVTPA